LRRKKAYVDERVGIDKTPSVYITQRGPTKQELTNMQMEKAGLHLPHPPIQRHPYEDKIKSADLKTMQKYAEDTATFNELLTKERLARRREVAKFWAIDG
jgi:hypothetical protein